MGRLCDPIYGGVSDADLASLRFVDLLELARRQTRQIEALTTRVAALEKMLEEARRAGIVSLIASTATSSGLKIRCELDRSHYEKGIQVSDEQMKSIHLTTAPFHGEWNYTISPRNS